MSNQVLHAGILRNRAEFLRRKTMDIHCACGEQWETAFSCWCGVEQLTGREYREADAIYWEDETKFIIRYRKDVFPDMRIRLGGAVYEITSITDRDNRHEALEILARMLNGDARCPDSRPEPSGTPSEEQGYEKAD